MRPLRTSWLVVGTPQNGNAALPSTLVPVEAERHKPVLAVDVDGVISVFGFENPADAPGDFHLIDGMAHCIPPGVGPRLCRLADHYDLVWATGWEDRANEHLPALLGLPGKLPYLTFAGAARFGTSHWKLDAIGRYAGARPLAWVDDCIDESGRRWAGSREAPTLLVPVEPARGLEEPHVEALIRWTERGFPDPVGDDAPLASN